MILLSSSVAFLTLLKSLLYNSEICTSFERNAKNIPLPKKCLFGRNSRKRQRLCCGLSASALRPGDGRIPSLRRTEIDADSMRAIGGNDDPAFKFKQDIEGVRCGSHAGAGGILRRAGFGRGYGIEGSKEGAPAALLVGYLDDHRSRGSGHHR
jgi:hypothetical protein